MAWTYGDWRSQSTIEARLARLNLHIQEREAAAGAFKRVGTGPHNLDNDPERQAISELTKIAVDMQGRVDRRAGRTVYRAGYYRR